MSVQLEVSPDDKFACATNQAKTKRFINRLQALESRIADALSSAELSEAAAQAKEKLTPVVDDFRVLLAKFSPATCLKEAFRAGTDTEAFGFLYERIDDLLVVLPGLSFSGADAAVSRAQDMLDDSEDLQQMLDLVKLVLTRPKPSSTPRSPASWSMPPAYVWDQLSREQLELLQARLTRVQHVGTEIPDQPQEQFYSAKDDIESSDHDKLPQSQLSTLEEDGSDASNSAPPRHTFRVHARPFNVIHKDDLQLKGIIGKGAWGKVYRAEWLGTEVAVKRLAAGITLHAKKLFVKEVELNASLDHKGIVKVFGACLGPTAIMVMELAKFGNLYEFIKDGPLLGLGMALDIMLQIAEAMEYLHSVGIAHRDLKSLNVLVCERLYGGKKILVRLADFGLAKVKHDVMTALNTLAGTYRWMAPEVMRGEVYKSSADIYSFAIVAYELLSSNIPYQGLTDPQVALMVAEKGVRPKIPDSLPPALKSLLALCWADDPAQRPSFTSIAAQLREMPALQKYQTEMEQLRLAEDLAKKVELTERAAPQSLASPPASPHVAPPQPGEGSGLTLLCSQDEAHAGSLLALVTHDGIVYSGGDDFKVKAWKLSADWKLALEGVMAGHSGSVQCLAVVPATETHAAMIASGSRDNSIKIWSTRDKTLMKSLDKHTGGVLALATNSNFLFSAADDKRILIWSIPYMNYVSSVKTLEEPPVCLAVNGPTLYAGMPNGAIHKIKEKGQRDMLVFTRMKHKVTQTLSAHSKHVSCLAVTKDMLCSGSWDQTIKVHDLETDSLKHVVEAQAGTDLVLGLVTNGHIGYSCSSGGAIQVWDLSTGKLLTSQGAAHAASVHCLAFLNGFLVSGSDDRTIKCWRYL